MSYHPETAPHKKLPLPPSLITVESTHLSAFSVVIAAYNAEKTIRRAVDSALAQTRRPREVVVCNDGSTDRTRVELSRYGDQIVVLDQPNRGVSAAKNAAVRASSGEYVVFLDSDDEWLPRRLQAIEEVADVDIVTTDAWLAVDGKRTGTYYRQPFPSGEAQPVEILRRNFIFGGAAVRRDALLAIGGFDEDVVNQGEYEAWVRLILSGSQARLVPEPLAIYHQTEGSLSSDPRPTCRVLLDLFDQLGGLSVEQRVAMNEHKRVLHRRLATAEAVREPRRGAAWRAAVVPGQPLTLRAKFAAATLVPGLAKRRMP